MEHQSTVDPTRKTVGAMAQEARYTDTQSMFIGDISHEIMKGLVDDINSALDDGRKEFPSRNFFVLVTEKWEAQLGNALYRKVAIFTKRPYPEQNTMCFRYDFKTNEVRFCWYIPERHDMWAVTANPIINEPELVSDIDIWERNELEKFGLMKTGFGDKWIENPHFKDRPMSEFRQQVKIYTS